MNCVWFDKLDESMQLGVVAHHMDRHTSFFIKFWNSHFHLNFKICKISSMIFIIISKLCQVLA